MMQLLERLFPCISWLRHYDRPTFKADFTAGCTVALVLVPQSMANAQLAGLPAYHGLYAALLPALIGGLFGSSRHIITSSVAITSIMASAALEPLVMTGTSGYIAYMILLTLMVGVVQLILGLCRMGILVSFLSLPVVSGFTNAAAVIIACSQLSKLFGVSVESSEYQYQTLLHVLQSAWNYTHLPTLLMALLALGIMWATKRFAPAVPAVLAAVALCTLVSWAVGFEKNMTADIDVLGSSEARELVQQLARQQVEMARITEELGELKQKDAVRPPVHPRAAAIESRHIVEQKALEKIRLGENMALTREHLRRMLFIAVAREDGGVMLYARNSPYLLPGTQMQAEPPPASESVDGLTWRIAIGNGIDNVHALHFRAGGSVVGSMPHGLPDFTLPDMNLQRILQLLPQALVIAFMGFAESISIAKAAASRFGYKLNPNQELVGQGLANIAGSVTLTSPVSGSFSNSAVNIAAGGKTGMAAVIAACGALLTLLLLTKALYYLPQPVLAVIVMRSVAGLVNVREFRRAWTARRHDGCIAMITFCATLYFAPHMDYGIGLGVLLSLMLFFYDSMRPSVVALSYGPDNVLRDVDVFGLMECRHIAVIHFQGVLFFANAGVLEDHVDWRLKNQKELRHIHLVCTGITQIDSSGEDTLAMLVKRTGEAGVGISFSGVVGSVAEVLDRTGVLKTVGWENVFISPREAIRAVHKRIKHDEGCTDCPLILAFSSEELSGENHKPVKG